MRRRLMTIFPILSLVIYVLFANGCSNVDSFGSQAAVNSSALQRSVVLPDGYGSILYQPSAGNHMEYTRAIKLANGNILAITNIKYSTNLWGIRIYRSSDNGVSFSFVTEFRDDDVDWTIGCETIEEVSSGNILLAYTVYNENDYTAGMQLRIQRSADNGSTWSYVTKVEDGTWNWEPEFSIAVDGSLQLFYSYSAYDMQIGAQAIVRRESTDGGTTWGDIVLVKGNVGIQYTNVGMPRIAKAADDLYYLMYECYENSTCDQINSSSDGKTFGALDDIGYDVQTPGDQWMCSTPAIAYVDGALIAIGKNYLNAGSGASPNQGLVALASRDGGATWSETGLPLEIVYNDDHQNWSPDFLPVSDTEYLFITVSYINGQDSTRYGIGSLNDDIPTYHLINRYSGLALDVYQASLVNGGDVIQWAYSGSDNQNWYVLDVGDGYANLMNAGSGLLLDVYGASSADGADAVQWESNGGYNQQWELEDLGTGYYRIISRLSGKALDVYQWATSNGGDVVQWTAGTGENQQWAIIKN